MDFVNETGVNAAWNVGLQPDGREVAIIVIKATYDFPSDTRGSRQSPALAVPQRSVEQVALIEADEYTGEPGLSAPLVETDYSVFKPYCDVLLNGSAHSPGGRPVEQIAVRMQVGRIDKTIGVYGNREWRRVGSSRPQLFAQMPISYDNAFGGVDRTNEAKGKCDTFVHNPVGQGYYSNSRSALGQAMPNTEELRNAVTSPKGRYQPMAYGPIGRAWFPRYKFAGTYDERWIEERMPILPTDFDSRYFQCAAQDQQCGYLQGGELVVLQNLTPSGLVTFSLPSEKMPVLFIPHQGDDITLSANIDTLMIDSDNSRFSITWRACLPLRRDCFDIRQAIAGTMSRSWYSKRRAEKSGKTYYAGLGAMVLAKRGR